MVAVERGIVCRAGIIEGGGPQYSARIRSGILIMCNVHIIAFMTIFILI